MAGLDDIIHQPLRLRIMAALNALPSGVGLEFARLKKLTGATDGNLGAHIETLSKAGYVAVEKAFVGKKPQTTVTATAAGRGAFARHVAMLQEIIAASGGSNLHRHSGAMRASNSAIAHWNHQLRLCQARDSGSARMARRPVRLLISPCGEGAFCATEAASHPRIWLMS